MDYRGIITCGYHVDAGGQNKISIISRGYVNVLAALAQIFNIVERTAYFQIIQAKNAGFTITKDEEVLF